MVIDQADYEVDYETIYEFLVDDSEMEVISGHQELPSYVEKVLETMKKCFNFEHGSIM